MVSAGVGVGNSSSSRKPLVQFNAAERARLVDLMPSKRAPKRGGRGKRRTRAGGGSKRLRVIKGRVNVRIPGYGLQKIAPSSLIPYLPSVKIRQAAKRVFNATHKGTSKKRTTRGRRRTRQNKRKRQRVAI